jgi:hypothetical protein
VVISGRVALIAAEHLLISVIFQLAKGKHATDLCASDVRMRLRQRFTIAEHTMKNGEYLKSPVA